MKTLTLTLAFGLAVSSYGQTKKADSSCGDAFKQVTAAVKESKKSNEDILNIVKLYAQRDASCLCDVVKASIIASEADKNFVKEIVETAILTAPNQLQAVVSCSIAIAPDASKQISEVAKKYSDTSLASVDSKVVHFTGKNGYAGGKNGGKNGGGGTGPGITNPGFDEAPSPLDNLSDGFLNTGFPNDANVEPEFTSSPTGTISTPIPFGDPEGSDPEDNPLLVPFITPVTPSQP